MLLILLNYMIHQILVILPYLIITTIAMVSIQGIVYKVSKISLYNKIKEVLVYGK